MNSGNMALRAIGRPLGSALRSDGDSCHTHSHYLRMTQWLPGFGISAAGYQMTMRSAGGRNIGSPGLISNASKNCSMLRAGCTQRTEEGACESEETR